MTDPLLRNHTTADRQVLVYGGLHYIRGNAKPYFSLTMNERIAVGGHWQEGTAGAAHAEILALFPELAPLAALHLADIDGMPPHTLENGWYWLQGATPELHRVNAYHGANGFPERTPAECMDLFAKMWRLHRRPYDEAETIRESVLTAWYQATTPYTRVWEDRPGRAACLECLSTWIVHYTPRWKEEADKCIADLGLVVYGDPWPITPQP